MRRRCQLGPPSRVVSNRGPLSPWAAQGGRCSCWLSSRSPPDCSRCSCARGGPVYTPRRACAPRHTSAGSDPSGPAEAPRPAASTPSVRFPRSSPSPRVRKHPQGPARPPAAEREECALRRRVGHRHGGRGGHQAPRSIGVRAAPNDSRRETTRVFAPVRFLFCAANASSGLTIRDGYNWKIYSWGRVEDAKVCFCFYNWVTTNQTLSIPQCRAGCTWGSPGRSP